MTRGADASWPRLTGVIDTIPVTVPFVGPEAQERARGQLFRARIGANENGFGPSPRAIAAMQAAVADTWMYGDPTSHDLIGQP
jgi:histidinol-phosphate aminotransferase